MSAQLRAQIAEAERIVSAAKDLPRLQAELAKAEAADAEARAEFEKREAARREAATKDVDAVCEAVERVELHAAALRDALHDLHSGLDLVGARGEWNLAQDNKALSVTRVRAVLGRHFGAPMLTGPHSAPLQESLARDWLLTLADAVEPDDGNG